MNCLYLASLYQCNAFSASSYTCRSSDERACTYCEIRLSSLRRRRRRITYIPAEDLPGGAGFSTKTFTNTVIPSKTSRLSTDHRTIESFRVQILNKQTAGGLKRAVAKVNKHRAVSSSVPGEWSSQVPSLGPGQTPSLSVLSAPLWCRLHDL